MAAAVTPEAQNRVQAELDRVVGQSRSASIPALAHTDALVPTFADKVDLQYALGFVKEALRWRPVSSGGFMHETTEELSYVRLTSSSPV